MLLCGPPGKGLFRLKNGKHLFLLNVTNNSSKFNLVLLALHEFLSTALKNPVIMGVLLSLKLSILNIIRFLYDRFMPN